MLIYNCEKYVSYLMDKLKLVQYIYQQNIYSNFYTKTFKNIKFIYKYENIIIYICNVTEYVKKEYTKHSHIYIYGLSTSQKKKRKQL